MADIFAMVDTWNNGATTFTAVKMNVTDTASAAGSLLMDLQVGGVSKEKTSKAGDKTMAGVFNSLSRGSASSLALGMDTNTNGFYVPATGNIGVVIGTTDAYRMRVADFTIGTALIGWGTNIDSPDLLIGRDAANILAQRNGGIDQQFRLYKTFTDASNHQRLFFDFNGTSSAARIATTWSGTGTAFDLEIGAGTSQWRYNNSGGHYLAVTDAISDIGASGANRPRNLYLSSFIRSGGTQVAVATKTANYTATTSDEVILADATSGAITITLPAASNTGTRLHIEKTDSSANAVTISRAGSDTIEGATTVSLAAQYTSRVLVAGGGTVWFRQASL